MTKAGAASKPKARRARQAVIPEMEDAKNEAIEAAARDYVEARDKRMEQLREEVGLREKLAGLLKEAGLDDYRKGTMHIYFEKAEKIKVKIGDQDPDDQNGE